MLMTKTMLAIVLFGGLLVQSGTGYKVVGHYSIGGVGGFDYISIDSSARRLYVSHGTQVEVLDADNGKIIGTIADTPGVHGAAIAAAFKHGFTSNGREHKVSMFDTATLQLIKKIDVGRGPDGIYYAGFDPDAHLIFFSCGDGNLSIYREKAANVYEDAGAVKTQPSAKTMAFDPKTKKIFLPAAEYTEGPPAQPGGRPTRTMKPGSFVIVVVGK